VALALVKQTINNLQTWKFARDYCCSLGLKLPSFPTMDKMMDAYNAVNYRINLIQYVDLCITVLSAGTGDLFFDETYANGDGTDSWCTTNEQVPVDMYYQQKYPIPQCDKWSCGIGELQAGAHYIYPIEDTPPTVSLCTSRDNIQYKQHILCA
jgi:hypothetical protein